MVHDPFLELYDATVIDLLFTSAWDGHLYDCSNIKGYYDYYLIENGYKLGCGCAGSYNDHQINLIIFKLYLMGMAGMICDL